MSQSIWFSWSCLLLMSPEQISKKGSNVYLGWGLLSQFPPFRYFPNFSKSPKHTLAIEYHVYIWQVSPQLSCGDTCQIWMWSKESNRYFCKIENFAYGEISERSFSNPTPGPLFMKKTLFCGKRKHHYKPKTVCLRPIMVIAIPKETVLQYKGAVVNYLPPPSLQIPPPQKKKKKKKKQRKSSPSVAFADANAKWVCPLRRIAAVINRHFQKCETTCRHLSDVCQTTAPSFLMRLYTSLWHCAITDMWTQVSTM